jgi:hypothetical protein
MAPIKFSQMESTIKVKYMSMAPIMAPIMFCQVESIIKVKYIILPQSNFDYFIFN